MRALGAAVFALAVAGASGATSTTLVYRTSVVLPRAYSCAAVPRVVDRLHLLPGGVLPAAGATANDPEWSPDGTRIAFSSGGLLCTNGDGVGQLGARLWVVSAAGGTPRAVTTRNAATGGPLDRSPSWSPDGRRLAFARLDIAAADSVDADGRGLRRLSPRWAVALDWSPDGRSIAFVPGEWAVFGSAAANRVDVLDLDSGRIRSFRVTRPSDLEWSPDGRTIAVAGDRAVELVDAKGGVVTKVALTAPRNLRLDGVTWSPDGRRLAFGSQGGIYTVGRAGGAARRIAAGGSPDWRR